MLIYEVDLLVDDEVAEAYRRWLEAHVEQIVDLPGFIGARLLVPEAGFAPGAAESGTRFVVQYALRDAPSLAEYLERHAPALRREGEERFPGRFRASRRVLRLEKTFGAHQKGATEPSQLGPKWPKT